MAAIFFDIDGTLWGMDHVIPESTKEALRLLKENGHQIFLCSGRTEVCIRDPQFAAAGFDGVVSGCGTCVTYRGEDLFYAEIPRELLSKTLGIIRRYGFTPLLEGRDHLFTDPEEFRKDPFGKYMLDVMGKLISQIRGNEEHCTACKFNVMINGKEYREAARLLEEDYQVFVQDGVVLELVPKECSKANGIERMCRQIGCDRADTYAFGDGLNDLEMLDFVGTGIAMGNAKDIVKQNADYVTDDLYADGIFNACRHFGLI